jgi:CheY-like chemotaxis protein
MPPNPATVRVLVVDDDREDCELIEVLLRGANRATFRVDSAHSADEALGKLGGSRYDVILVDWRLNGGGSSDTGLDFKRSLDSQHYTTPVVLVTNHGDKRLQDQALEEGVAEYLEKGTFSTEILERTCLYAIGLSERQKANGGAPGLGIMLQELVSLTRESVNAQTGTKTEISGLRSDFATEFGNLEKGCVARSEEVSTTVSSLKGSLKDVQKELKDKDKVKWLLDWVDEHRATASVIFASGVAAIVVLVIVSALVLQVTDTNKIKDITEAATSSVTIPLGG